MSEIAKMPTITPTQVWRSSDGTLHETELDALFYEAKDTFRSVLIESAKDAGAVPNIADMIKSIIVHKERMNATIALLYRAEKDPRRP